MIALIPSARVDLGSQSLGPRLPAEQAELERVVLRVDAGILQRLRDHERVRRGGDEDVRTEVAYSIAWRAVWPPDTGTTVAPIRSPPW